MPDLFKTNTQPLPLYTISDGTESEKASEKKITRPNMIPTFNLTVNASTVYAEYEKFSKELSAKQIPSVTFKVEDRRTLKLSITPDRPLNADADQAFRSAIALLNGVGVMTTRDNVELLQKYENYLRRNDLQSKYVAHQHKSGESMRAGGFVR